MKKLFFLLTFLICQLTYGQTIVHGLPVKYTSAPQLTANLDSIMFIDTDNVLKYVEYSDFIAKVAGDIAASGEPLYIADSARTAKFDYGGDFTEPLKASGNAGEAWDGDLVATLQYLYDNYHPLAESGVAGETVSVGDIVYQDDASYNWYKASASNLSHISSKLGMVVTGNTATNPITVSFDRIRAGSGWTPKTLLYVGTTAGTITETPPSGSNYVRVIGATINATTRYINTQAVNYVKGDGSEVNGVALSGGAPLGVLSKPMTTNYTTETADNGYTMDFSTATPTTITLSDDVDVQVGDQFYFYNDTGSAMSWAFGTSDSALEGTLNDLPDNAYGWARLVAANTWSVIDGSASGGSGGGDVYLASSNVFTGASQTFQGSGGIFVQNGNNNVGGTSKLYIGEGTGFTHTFSGVDTELQLAIGSVSTQFVFDEDGVDSDYDVIRRIDGDGRYWQQGSIDFGWNGFSIGSGVYGTPAANKGWLRWENNAAKFTIYDSGSSAQSGYVSFDYDGSFGQVYLDMFDNVNSDGVELQYNGTSDSFHINNATAVGFDNAIIQAANLSLFDDAGTTDTVITGYMGESIFYTSSSAVTVTLPDTLSETDGATFTVIAEGTGGVTVSVSGTATINGGSTSIVIAGASGTPTKINGVQFIHKGDNTDDWIAIGAY